MEKEYEKYYEIANRAFDFARADFMKNLDVLAQSGKEIPLAVDVSFTVNFKLPEKNES
jgi:hypothetical protein